MAERFKSSFGKKLKPSVVANKGSRSELLPSRHALATLTKGNPAERSVLNYGKLTPIGANAPKTFEDIVDLVAPKERR